MLNGKEIGAIIISSIIVGFCVTILGFTLNAFLYALLAVFLVIMINVIAKKIASHYLESQVEVKLWEIKRYGFKAHSEFKRPLLAGIIVPLITTVVTLGYVTWMTPLVFDVKAKIYRAAKRHGLYSFSEMTEWHIGLIAAAGIFANLVFAVLGYLTGFSLFAKLCVYYAFFNMIPLSELDGNKLFFGSLVLWSFLAAITLIGTIYVLWLP